MGGITAILALIRALWPFFREALFGRAPVQAWLKKNFFSLIWLFFVIAMFVVVLKLSATIRTSQGEIKTLTVTNKALQQSFTTDETKLLQYKTHPELVCPTPVPAVKESKVPKAEPTNRSPVPVKSTDPDQDVLNLLKRIHAEEP